VRPPALLPLPPRGAQAYALRCALRGHGEDVRCVALAGELGVATASRDRTLRLWPFSAASPGGFGEPTVFVGHANFVTALAWAPPGALAGAADASQGALVSGSRDAAVFVWDVRTGEPTQRLTGHTQQVRALRTWRRQQGAHAGREAEGRERVRAHWRAAT
jgi:WD40 repeat protein